MTNLTLQQVETIIAEAKPEQQRRLLAKLPRLLKISATDLTLLKISESSFDFWNNPDDAIYDKL